jgi:hypothetical protein
MDGSCVSEQSVSQTYSGLVDLSFRLSQSEIAAGGSAGLSNRGVSRHRGIGREVHAGDLGIRPLCQTERTWGRGLNFGIRCLCHDLKHNLGSCVQPAISFPESDPELLHLLILV